MARKRSQSSANKTIQESQDDGKTQMVSGYEQSREERIKENLERMQKLGILDLSLQLKSVPKPSPRFTPSTRRTSLICSPLPPPGPTRRSSRLQRAAPVSYAEVKLTKKEDSMEEESDLLREGSKPEFYTEEHEKLLGSTEQTWTLFVDGCGKDGKRIYDPVNGKTCHQCRQKTLGHRTHCSKCNMVQGQFCGDCLYMRYGEHVLEAKQNHNWICPVCRGICNCSFCRQAKGWAPTGTLYRRITKLGYKSVAHYLIQTRRAEPGTETDLSTKVPLSAKRSLPLEGMETPSVENESPQLNNPQELVNPHSEVAVLVEKGMETPSVENESPQLNNNQELVNPHSEVAVSVENPNEVTMQGTHCSADERGNCEESEHATELVKKPELGIDSIADFEGSVRTESHSNGTERVLQREKENTLQLSPNNGDHKSEESLMDSVIKRPNEEAAMDSVIKKPNEDSTEPSPSPADDMTCNIICMLQNTQSGKPPAACKGTPTSQKYRARTSDTVADSIGGRLRKRRANIEHGDSSSLVIADGEKHPFMKSEEAPVDSVIKKPNEQAPMGSVIRKLNEDTTEPSPSPEDDMTCNSICMLENTQSGMPPACKETPISQKKCAFADSIAGRLKKRRANIEHGDSSSPVTADGEKDLIMKSEEAPLDSVIKEPNDDTNGPTPSPEDDITRNICMLKNTQFGEPCALKETPMSQKKHAHTSDTVADSIAGRLRKRRGNIENENTNLAAAYGGKLVDRLARI